MKMLFKSFFWIILLQIGVCANSFSFENIKSSYLLHDEYYSVHYANLLNEQANLEFCSKKYTDSLNNYERTIQHLKINNLTDPSVLLNAICGSMFCYDMLNQNEFAKRTFDELVYQVGLLGQEIENID